MLDNPTPEIMPEQVKAVHAIAELAYAEQSDVVAAVYGADNQSFGSERRHLHRKGNGGALPARLQPPQKK